MKEILIKKYECDWCKNWFDTPEQALYHEREVHKCPNCKHVWYLYGSEKMCDLNKCRFKPKDENKC